MNKILSHPTTINYKWLALGFIAGLLWQKHIGLNENITNINSFLNSQEFQALLVACYSIFAVLQHGSIQQPPTTITIPTQSAATTTAATPQQTIITSAPIKS
jgi:uncharacterized membrane protein